MGGKKSKSTSKTTADPWIGAQPFLVGGPGAQGVFPESNRIYQQSQSNKENQAGNNAQYGAILNQRDNGYYDDINQGAKNALGGYFNPKISAVGETDRVDPVGVERVSARGVNPGNVNIQKARKDQGELDPTNALGRLLGGQVTNPYIQNMSNAVTNQIGRNFSENVAPSIRSNAVASGQYGGSKQGIAEGLAMSRMNQDIAQAVAPLHANAYESAQNRMLQTGGMLNQQAQNVTENNVNRNFQAQDINARNQLQADLSNSSNLLQAGLNNAQRDQARNQFNANLGLQNNSQEMQRANQDMNSRMVGLQALGMGQALQDQNYANQTQLTQQPQNYDWDQLNRYASIITPGAGLGGSSTSSQPSFNNPLLSAGGGALSGAALGPWGAAAGGTLGLLGGFV